MSARLVAAAVKAALTDGGVACYDTDEVPAGKPAEPYVVLFCDTGVDGAYRLSAGASAARWRVLAQHVGNRADDARWAAEKAQAALQRLRLNVAGYACTPMYRESSQPVRRDPDEAVWVGSDVWVFVTTPTS